MSWALAYHRNAETSAAKGRKRRRRWSKEEESHSGSTTGSKRYFLSFLYSILHVARQPVAESSLFDRVDLSELSLGSTMRTDFPNPDDILNFTLIIEPDEGMYKMGTFNFSFAINQNFPHDPPKVKCMQKIYHPNIDLEGNVCLNILREDWKPVLNLNAVIVGLQVGSVQGQLGQ